MNVVLLLIYGTNQKMTPEFEIPLKIDTLSNRKRAFVHMYGKTLFLSNNNERHTNEIY